MRELPNIVFVNLINDLDNVLVIIAIMKKFRCYQKSFVIYTALLLTLSRSLLVGAVDSLSVLPGLRLICGAVVLVLALRIVLFPGSGTEARGPVPTRWVKISALLLLADFSICLDSVVVTAELSSHVATAAIGIFCSLLLVFLLIRLLPDAVTDSGWLQILAAGLMTHIAFLGIVKDPWIADALVRLERVFIETDTNKASQIMAVDLAAIVIMLGIVQKYRESSGK